MRPFKTALCVVGVLSGIAHAQSSNATLPISLDGSCGAAVNQTCLKSTYGDCCSARGYCGGTTDYCNPTNGCQSSFGSCTTSSVISIDGRCGSQDPLHQVCIGSEFGSCCSTNGWCGNSTTYCGQGCQSSAGTCGGAGITINTGSNATTSSSSTSPSSITSSNPSPSSNGSNSSPAATSSELENTKSSLKATQAGLGVVVALLAISLIAVGWLVFSRKRDAKAPPLNDQLEKPLTDIERSPAYSPHVPITPANMISPISEGPNSSYPGNMNKWPYSKVEAHELGSSVGPVELRGSETGAEKDNDKK